MQSSHPSRVRELKPRGQGIAHYLQRSHPSRVRELKHNREHPRQERHQSHPSRVRELKLTPRTALSIVRTVAPLPGA